MTATAEKTDKTDKDTNGRVVRVTGPVVDVEFPRGSVPELFNALHAEITYEELAKTLTLEVAQHLGDSLVRCISMQPTDGLVRGVEVIDTGELDLGAGRRRRQGPRVQRAGRLPRRPGLRERLRPLVDPPQAAGLRRAGTPHRDAGDRPQGRRPADPVRARRQDRAVRRRRRGQDGADPGDDQPHRPQLRRHLGVRRRGRAHP